MQGLSEACKIETRQKKGCCEMKQTGFIGLGIMGKPMAKNLQRSGVRLMVCDRDPAAAAELLAAGAKQGSPMEIGAACDVIFTMLPSGPVVREVLFGRDGVASALQAGAIVCDMSSVTPAEARFCYEKLKAAGVGFVDSPVSGGEPRAADGTLAFMAGGDREIFEQLTPYFSAMGASAHLVGGAGSGSVAKLANQVIVNLTIAAVSEAFVLAAKAGAQPELVYQAIRDGLAGSAVLDAKLPMMLERDFTPGGKISINRKDIQNVLATAHTVGVPMPMTAQLFELLQALCAAGEADNDHSGIVRYFERLAGVTVAKRGEV